VSRVLRGDVRQGPGGLFVVLRTERGRANEARTVVVVGRHVGYGRAYPRETRALATVAAWPLVGRVMVTAILADGGYIIATRSGAMLPAEES
jgi:hypothetical protein